MKLLRIFVWIMLSPIFLPIAIFAGLMDFAMFGKWNWYCFWED